MYQPTHLGSFLRLLVSHLETVVNQGEQLIKGPSREMRMDLLQEAIEHGQQTADQESLHHQRNNEDLFVLRMSQSREWVDRLGRFDPEIERQTDEFLAATFSIEHLLHKSVGPIQDGLAGHVDIEMMMRAIFELLARLEEQYDLMEELYDIRQVANGIPLESQPSFNQSAKVIPLFSHEKQTVRQDFD